MNIWAVGHGSGGYYAIKMTKARQPLEWLTPKGEILLHNTDAGRICDGMMHGWIYCKTAREAISTLRKIEPKLKQIKTNPSFDFEIRRYQSI